MTEKSCFYLLMLALFMGSGLMWFKLMINVRKGDDPCYGLEQTLNGVAMIVFKAATWVVAIVAYRLGVFQ